MPQEATVSANQNSELKEMMAELLNNDADYDLISLCTVDGFSIECLESGNIGVESDKLSAMASTFCSMGNSISEQMLKRDFNISSVEASGAHMLFSCTSYMDRPCVLTVVTRGRISVGEARYKTKRLSGLIGQISC